MSQFSAADTNASSLRAFIAAAGDGELDAVKRHYTHDGANVALGAALDGGHYDVVSYVQSRMSGVDASALDAPTIDRDEQSFEKSGRELRASEMRRLLIGRAFDVNYARDVLDYTPNGTFNVAERLQLTRIADQYAAQLAAAKTVANNSSTSNDDVGRAIDRLGDLDQRAREVVFGPNAGYVQSQAPEDTGERHAVSMANHHGADSTSVYNGEAMLRCFTKPQRATTSNEVDVTLYRPGFDVDASMNVGVATISNVARRMRDAIAALPADQRAGMDATLFSDGDVYVDEVRKYDAPSERYRVVRDQATGRVITVVTGDASIAYTVAGTRGPVVMLLHGVPTNREQWVPVMRVLARWCRVIAIDLPGMGESWKPLSNLTAAERIIATRYARRRREERAH